jgi:hypothetical protein
MLVQVLDRQGLDLSFTTNNLPLLYLDFSGNTVNVRGQGGYQVFNVYGNLGAANGIILENSGIITTGQTNQPLVLQANGTANVTIVRANVTSGKLNNTTVGIDTPAAGTFTFLNSTRLTSGAGRVTFTDSQGLIDNDDFRYFTSNSTLVAGNVISKSGTVGYGNITLTSSLTLLSAAANSISFFGSDQKLITTGNLQYFSANGLMRLGNNSIRLTSLPSNRLLYTDSNSDIKNSQTLQYDGVNMTATGITTLGNITFSTNQIGTTVADLLIAPAGKISVQGRYISDLPSPVSPNDAVTKQYVDDRTAQSSVNTIGANPISGSFNSYVTVNDNALHVANVKMVVDGTLNSTWTDTYANIFSVWINSGTIGTQAGRLILQPGNNDKIQSATKTALTLPVGQSIDRPTTPDVGDIRYNQNLGTIEWYDGVQWDYPTTGSTTIGTEMIYPDGVNSVYTLGRSTTTEAALVSINGVVQVPNQSYSIAGSVITFNEVPITTDYIEVRFLNTVVAYASNPIVVDTPYVTIGSSFTTVDQFYITFYRTARYTYSASSASTGANGQHEIGDVYVAHNGVSAFVQLNNRLNTSAGTLISFSVSIDAFGVLSLTARGTASDTKIKFHRMYMTQT